VDQAFVGKLDSVYLKTKKKKREKEGGGERG